LTSHRKKYLLKVSSLLKAQLTLCIVQKIPSNMLLAPQFSARNLTQQINQKRTITIEPLRI